MKFNFQLTQMMKDEIKKKINYKKLMLKNKIKKKNYFAITIYTL
jgi:hypothetical protein